MAGALDTNALSAFLNADFDAVDFARRSLEEHGASYALELVRRQRSEVEAALTAHVGEHNKELLARLEGSGEQLRLGVNGAKQHASALSASLGRLGRDVSDSYVQMRTDVAHLRNILATARVLDRTKRFLKAVVKLRGLLEVSNKSTSDSSDHQASIRLPDSARELAKAAQVLHDIEYLLGTGEMDGVYKVEMERDWIAAAGRGVRARTEMVLNRAITEADYQSEVAPALQAFFNLGVLPERVEAALDWVVANIADEVHDALDAHALSEAVEAAKEASKNDTTAAKVKAVTAGTTKIGSGRIASIVSGKKKRSTTASMRIKPPTGQETAWKVTLWSRVEALEQSIRTWSLRVWNLQRVLSKKRDPISHVCFADQVAAARRIRRRQQQGHISGEVEEEEESIFESFWRQMASALHGEVENAARAYPFIRSVLGVSEYPRMRALFRALPARLAQRTAGKSMTSVGGSSEEVRTVLCALQPLLEVFLAQSHHRLKETVELMLPDMERGSALPQKQEALPTKSDIVTFARAVAEELTAGRGDMDLTAVLARGASNAIALFASKAEDVVVMDSDAYVFHGVDGVSNDSHSELNGKLDKGESAGKESSAVEQTEAQVHNVAMLELVLRLLALVNEMPEKTTPTNAERREALVKAKAAALSSGADRLETLAFSIIQAYLAGAARALDGCLARIHLEDFGSSSPDAFESDLMQRFARAVEVVRVHHLVKLPKEAALVKDLSDHLQDRTVAMFNRHVSLVRPINADGRVRLANELAQFELAVYRLSLDSADGGKKRLEASAPYKELRALRQLLFLEDTIKMDGDNVQAATAAKVVACRDLLSSSLRVTTAWHAIFADAPPQLRSPCDVAAKQLSPSKLQLREQAYSEAMDRIELAGATAGGDALKVGTSLVETPAVKAFVWDKISASLELYQQVLSTNNQDELCTQFNLLQNLAPFAKS